MLGATKVEAIVICFATEFGLAVAAEVVPRIAAAGMEDRAVVRMLGVMRTRITAKSFAMVFMLALLQMYQLVHLYPN